MIMLCLTVSLGGWRLTVLRFWFAACWSFCECAFLHLPLVPAQFHVLIWPSPTPLYLVPFPCAYHLPEILGEIYETWGFLSLLLIVNWLRGSVKWKIHTLGRSVLWSYLRRGKPIRFFHHNRIWVISTVILKFPRVYLECPPHPQREYYSEDACL